jgi:ATP-dependent helicase HrpB
VTLPIEPILPDIRDALGQHGRVVVQAPPGAGKTTLVPLALLGAPWLAGQSIVMLEPRRVATRAAAWRLAELNGDDVGQTVGYRMRGERRIGRATRLEVVTEGVLTRRLQRDPTLDGVGVLIFDEFHERSLDADLGLALALRTRALLRDDLRLAVMSATLDGESVARLLGDAPMVTSHGRSHPVETRYVEPRRELRIESAMANAIVDALRRDPGDLLAFLPGAAEIRRVESLLADRVDAGVIVTPLFGMLDRDAQDRALFPDRSGRRKVVLSTSIAETSLTIEGIRIVVDGGLSRVPRFSPSTGMARLDTVRVSRASADQRRGRAGRVASGVCYRLWPEHETLHLLEQSPPQILHADLAPLALDLAVAGVSDPSELAWLDTPPDAAYSQARELLSELDAIVASGTVTAHGRAMADIGVHPRLAHMLIRANDAGATLACAVAALLSERDVIRTDSGTPDSDLSRRIDLMRGARDESANVDRDALRRARTESARLASRFAMGATVVQGSSDSAVQLSSGRAVQLSSGPAVRQSIPSPEQSLGSLVALAYPDRVSRRRPGTRARFVLRNGRGAELAESDPLSSSPFIVAAQLDDRKPESRVFLAAAIDAVEVRELFADQIEITESVDLDETTGAVSARRVERLGAIVLRESVMAEPSDDSIRVALLDAIRRRGIAGLPWSDGAVRLRQRMGFVAAHDASWPAVSDHALWARIDEWLAPSLTGVRRLSALERIDLGEALASLLDWRQRRALDALAPSHVVVPTGSRIPIDYSDPSAPTVAVRLQEVFGLTESPRLLDGRVVVTMQLLSPAHRPVQTTRDLAGFWRTSYFDVRKELRGRYPRHEWPEDPLSATPTKRAKPRR